MSQQEPPEIEAAKQAYRTAWPGQKRLMAQRLKDARTAELVREIKNRMEQK